MRYPHFVDAVESLLRHRGLIDSHGKLQLDTRQLVAAMFEELLRAIREDSRIVIPGFGVFYVCERTGRRVRPFGRKKVVELPPHWYVAFRSGKRTRGRLELEVRR